MNRKMSRTEHARRLAVALRDTSQRYVLGLMGRATWKAHTAHLWALADGRRLRASVARELGIGGSRGRA